MTSTNEKNGASPSGSAAHSMTLDPWEQSRPDAKDGNDSLEAAKLTKSEAEYARQNIANEILEAAKTVCGELIADTERTLEKARYLESEADRKHVEAHEERERAAEIRLEAEEYREALIEDSKRQSAEHIERARASAERECAELKKRASIEAEKLMAQAQLMRAAALEELEAQKIYAEAARFKAASQDTLDQARNRLGDARTSALLKPAPYKEPEAPAPYTQPVKNNNQTSERVPAAPVTGQGNVPSEDQGQTDRATVTGGLGTEPAQESRDSAKALGALEELRSMQEAASKAVDAALAEDRKPATLKRTTKRKKATTTK
ncbi:MAG: hypothetical protein O3A93_03685 [Chloroflexi bacterium]|nr:hypothetical protein [Chloroflexota bacterium]MDA1270348.1 hypothetical protein [Chloroflexota bacterium]